MWLTGFDVPSLATMYKYPPEGAEEALSTVMKQCELWADTSIAVEYRV